MKDVLNLPNGWAATTLENVCEIVAGNPAPQGDAFFENGTFNFVRVQDMGRLGDVTYLTETSDRVNELAISKLRLFPKGSVLFTKSGASTLNNQRAILGKDSYVVSHIAAAIPEAGISCEWIYFFLKCVDFVDLAHSSVMPSLPLSKVKPIQILIPPTSEQNRIVAKIEELFSELDKGIENLKAAQSQIKVYRQALLKHAFEGKLTAQWRAENKDKLETAEALLQRIQTERAERYQQQLVEWEAAGKQGNKPKAPKPLPPLTAEELADLPELPDGWRWVKLGQLTCSVKDGPHFSPKYVEKGIPFISAGNVKPEGVDFNNVKHISKEVHDELCKRCKPEIGDVLYTKGGTTGIARVNTYEVDFNIWVHVAVLKLIALVKPFYLQHVLNSSFCYSQSQKYTHGVGNQDLGLTRMVHIVLPICSFEEQEEVVRIIDDKMSVIDQLEQPIATSLQQAEALRQSILKKAFSGQLVPQDPHDEPASKLLERIRAERSKAVKSKQGRKAL